MSRMSRMGRMGRTSRAPRWLLRAAGVLALLLTLGHSLGAPWTPSLRPGDVELLSRMRGVPFEAMGQQRTYWDFYVGFGWSISAYLLALAVLTLQLSFAASLRAVRWPAATLALAFAIAAGMAWHWFFPLPALMALGTGVLIAAAVLAELRGAGKSG